MDKKRKVFKVWPEVPGFPYGPRPKQKLLFIEELPDEDTWVEDPSGEMVNLKRPHYHPIDAVLYQGGARGGKSAASVARSLSFLLKYPGSTAIIGAISYPVLKRTMLKEWGNRFKRRSPWDDYKYKDRVLIKKPTQNDMSAVLANGSQAFFLHLTDDEILRGIDADIIAFEEASLIPSESSFEELGRRLSGRKGPVRQIILTTNPTSRGGWLDEKFKLHQLRSNFTGVPEPICKPCNCHLCTKCKAEYEDGRCPNCDHPKANDCPGNQVWMRVIQTKSSDMDVIPEDYVESMEAFMDEKTHRVFVGGSTEDVRAAEVYKSYSEDNVFKTDQPLDMDKDLIWTLDFNFEPQCSVICQEHETTAGFQIKVLDEIVRWNALPSDAANAFCKHPEVVKWSESNRTVYIYGDPAGLYGTGNNLVPSFYKTIHEILLKQGFDVKIMMHRPDKDAAIKEPVKIPVAGRVDAVNAMLRKDDQIRLMINPRCQNLRRSLSEVRWSEDGKNIDKAIDRRAARKQADVSVMTHPTDALGYYVYKRFPVLKNKSGMPFIQFPGDAVYEYQNGIYQTADRTDQSDRVKQKIEARAARRAERAAKREADAVRRQGSMRGILGALNLWPSNGDMSWPF